MMPVSGSKISAASAAVRDRRGVTNDHATFSAAARRLISAIEQGDVVGWTSDLVVAEIVFVLSNPKTYAVPRDEIRDSILPLLGLPGIQIERKRLYRRVFELYTSFNIDYVDAYHAALTEHYGQQELYSFDTDFDSLPSIVRIEP